MSSRLLSEVRWFVSNYVIIIVGGFVFGLAQGASMIVASADGSLAGWSGTAVEQVFWWAVGIVVFGPLVLGIPVLVVSLVVWRLLTRALGHSRRSAFLVAAIVVLFAATSIPRADVQSIVLFVVVPAFTFAAVARTPPVPTNGVSSTHRVAQ
ncbi:MAG TPA: hypothetical protein VLR93_01570 [Patescibacteria group bacterium]|nr:hypothetical protein [Patescibacteria group bacterium]